MALGTTILPLLLVNEAATERLGAAIAAQVSPGVVIGLTGPLGAGKTRLVKAIARNLGVPEGAVSSPTFVLVHEYSGGLPVFHFDAYRLGDAAEFEALGAYEYFQAGGVCLVEWADRVAPCLPEDAWSVRSVHDHRDAARRHVEIRADVKIAKAIADAMRV